MTLTTQTSAALIDGKAWAERVLVEVADSVAQLEAEGTTPGLAVVLIGEDAASQVYVRNQFRKADAVGIRSLEYRFDTSCRRVNSRSQFIAGRESTKKRTKTCKTSRTERLQHD